VVPKGRQLQHLVVEVKTVALHEPLRTLGWQMQIVPQGRGKIREQKRLDRRVHMVVLPLHEVAELLLHFALV